MGRGNDASLPCGARICCRCADSTLFAPAGQKRFRVGAPDFGWFAGQRWMKKRFAFKNGLAGAPERRGKGAALDCRAFLCEHPARGSAQDHLPTPFTPPVFTQSSRGGDRRGSARTRSRDQSLENPFLGDGSRFSKTPQAAGPCSWACRRLLAPPPQPDRNAARPPPTRGAGVRQHGAEGAGFRYYRTAASSAARPET